MEIYRRIINKRDKNDDCIYQLVFGEFGYRWHYRRFTNNSNQHDVPIIYRETSKYRLDGILAFDPQDLESIDGNSTTNSE